MEWHICTVILQVQLRVTGRENSDKPCSSYLGRALQDARPFGLVILFCQFPTRDQTYE